MAQASIQRYFNTRKRPADDNLNKISKKVLLLENPSQTLLGKFDEPQIIIPASKGSRTGQSAKQSVKHKLNFDSEDLIRQNDKESSSLSTTTQQPKKVVTFTQLGPMSPKKRLRSQANTKTESILKGEVQAMPSNKVNRKNIVKPNDMTIDEIKEKITKSRKLVDLKASLLQLNKLETKRQELRKLNSLNQKEVNAQTALDGGKLKTFHAIDLDIESPRKEFKTPEKVQKTPTPQKRTDLLMSPRQESIKPRKLLFSPSKALDPSCSATVVPAFERYRSLVVSLELPFKYRSLLELFKCCDTVCAMFYNRKEKITFKKLKPAIQRMCRKNFTEDNLAQIKFLLPEAYEFYQNKMRNFGSVSKQDYYQLVINPLIKSNGAPDDDLLNSQRLMERLNKFQSKLVDKAMDDHDKFLASLKPPLKIARKELRRWHPDFDLEGCADIPKAEIPQPPNVEKFSSAKDILSTARNLFNCATPMERAMERLEAKRLEKMAQKDDNTDDHHQPIAKVIDTPKTSNPVASMLKGVPASLLEKIRAKEAAKALSIMTRRPSAEKEAEMYSRLPELARHVRNVFITEKKSCLAEEIVMNKIMNSFRANLTLTTLYTHLQLLSKETESWITFLEIRKVKYLKMSRETDVAKMMDKLQALANEKLA